MVAGSNYTFATEFDNCRFQPSGCKRWSGQKWHIFLSSLRIYNCLSKPACIISFFSIH